MTDPRTPSGHLRLRRLTPDALLALLLPVACVIGLLLVRPVEPADVVAPPEETALTTASVVCPGLPAEAGDGDVVGVTTLAAGSGGSVSGTVETGLGDATATIDVQADEVTSVRRGSGPTVVTGTGELAPALLAGRSTTSPLTALDCRPTAASQWFTGVGSGATHGSVVELVNPYGGSALADLTLWAPAGLLDVPGLLGVAVPGGTRVTLDLSEIVPRRGELALHATTTRGRLAVNVVDTHDELGTGLRVQDWLPPQPEPQASNLLLGLARGEGERTLVLGNPGSDELRATLKLVTPRSVFAPAGVEPVRIAPGSTQKVTISDLLDEATGRGAFGVLVDSTGPLTATLRQLVGGDLSLVAPAAALTETTGVVVPTGRKRLMLADPSAVGVATVTAFTATGEELTSRRVELTPDTGVNLDVPEQAVLVTVVPERTSVRAAVLVVGDGTAVVTPRELLRTGLVPDVRPGLF